MPVKRYEGVRAEDIERDLSKDMAVSLVSHAMWLGRELARTEQRLNSRVHKDRAAAGGQAGGAPLRQAAKEPLS